MTYTAMLNNTCLSAKPGTFDLASSPLEGVNLIDASAGTGKTYTICGLVLRLLLEKDLTMEQILVVTYTEAATEDLRDRIRQRLRQALDGISAGSPDGDEFLRKYLGSIQNAGEAAQRISEALRSFDEAAIFTIHGFCQRMLIEYSFESNTLLDTELITDDSALVREILEDFCRRTLSRSSDLFSRYAADKLTPEALHDFLAPFIPHSFLQFIPAIEISSASAHLSEAEAEFMEAHRAVCHEWPAIRHEVLADLLNSGALKRTTYSESRIDNLIRAMDDMAAAGCPAPQLFDRFVLLTSGKIEGAAKKGKTPNILPIYRRCENLLHTANNLLSRYDQYLLALKKRLLDSFRHELNRRKERDNVYSFDDLLRRLHGAVTGPGGDSFASTVARKYPAALIDEFQDTDPLQFEIFKAIYGRTSLLFLIGDPKQAIYSFRGADIFTYMDAAAGLPLAHHTLGINHRSSPALVKAINTVFCRTRNPFVFEAISFQPVSAAQKPEPEHLAIDGDPHEPFIVCYIDKAAAAAEPDALPQKGKNRIAKSAARRLITTRVAAEIARLLGLASENRACINNRKLLPGDIAVLVRKNDEARKMQKALNALRIPSVVHSSADLFASEEANELSLLLHAIAAPHSISRIKTGLLTRFIGLQANGINLLQNTGTVHEKGIEPWLTKFRTYHDLWNRYGFIRMFWTVMSENRVRQRLLASVNGERSLTNILHLAEILQQEAVHQGLNMPGLLGYLHERLSGDQGKNIESQLRLESDEARVKIVTIHKSKGLEYPVVFCPFTWEGSRLHAAQECLFHRREPGRGTELIFDAGSPELENHLQSALQEEMAENLRLLYVALTRAVHRCYLFWGPISSAETSAPAYLLHQGPMEISRPASGRETQNALMARLAARVAGLTDHEILADLQDLAAAGEGTIRIAAGMEPPLNYLPAERDGTMDLGHRQFKGAITSDWQISSFSSLIAGRSAVMEPTGPLQDSGLDRDEIPALRSLATEQADSSPDIFSFPHGAKPGTFLHEILEQADFTREKPVAAHLIIEKLQHFGYEANWYPVIAELLENLGNIQLHKDICDLKLSNVVPAKCLHELEFYFPLARINPDDLKEIFCINDLPGSGDDTEKLMDMQLDSLTFAPARGFMRGFIDLVFEFDAKFYLVDWKSNYLGSGFADYGRDKLFASILSGFYFLQYHIYCLALDLYLEKRQPGYAYESHFGGIFYLYLRGVKQELGPAFGVYHDRPDLSTIEMLKAKFLAGKQAGTTKQHG